jgi:hypothetical protein
MELQNYIKSVADCMDLGSALSFLTETAPEHQTLEHWQQGEFHHDWLFQLPLEEEGGEESRVLVVSTNCNGGIKEVLALPAKPERSALWNWRCPDNPEFNGNCPKPLGLERTHHWFDPCNLLKDTARSEYRAEFRQRQPGGGWILKNE